MTRITDMRGDLKGKYKYKGTTLHKVKIISYNVTSSVCRVFAHNSTKKSRRSTKLRGRWSVPRVTLSTSFKVKSSKVKVTRPLNAVTENQPLLE